MTGWEWPGEGQHKCGAKAEDRRTGKRIYCGLRVGHSDQMHHWEQIEDDQLLAASWIATGHITLIGSPVSV